MCLLSGCGLVLDLTEQPDAAGLDGGMRQDGDPPRIDASRLDADRPDAGDCDPTDYDGDGQSECTGDCDESNADVHTGAPLNCDDGVVNDCVEAADVVEPYQCAGFFVARDGDDDNGTGAWNDPFRTVGRGVEAAHDVGGAAVSIAEGDYREEQLQLRTNVRLIGGLERATWRWTGAVETALEVEQSEGVTITDGARNVALQTLTIFSTATENASTVHMLGDSQLQVLFCDIRASNDSSDFSYGIRSESFSGINALEVVGGSITLGDSGTNTYGVLARGATFDLFGTNIWLVGRVTDVEMGVWARETPSGSFGFERVVIAPGDGASNVPLVSYGANLDGGSGDVIRTVILSGRCQDDCMALRMSNPRGPVRVENGYFAGQGPERSRGPSAGLFMKFEPDAAGTPTTPPRVVVTSNLIVGSMPGVSPRGNGVILDLVRNSVVTPFGVFRNNILWSGPGPQGVAFQEVAPDGGVRPAELTHNALYNANGEVSPYRYELDGVMGVIDLNANGWASGNIFASCGIDPLSRPPSLELPSGSRCIDEGAVEPEVVDDFDEDAVRPVGPGWDIGPQEYDATRVTP